MNFMLVRRKKIVELMTEVRGGARYVPGRVLDTLLDPGGAMGLEMGVDETKDGCLSVLGIVVKEESVGKWSCDSCMGCGRIGDSVRLCNSGIVVCSGGGGLGGDGGDCGHFDVASGGGNEEASLLRHGVRLYLFDASGGGSGSWAMRLCCWGGDAVVFHCHIPNC